MSRYVIAAIERVVGSQRGDAIDFDTLHGQPIEEWWRVLADEIGRAVDRAVSDTEPVDRVRTRTAVCGNAEHWFIAVVVERHGPNARGRLQRAHHRHLAARLIGLIKFADCVRHQNALVCPEARSRGMKYMFAMGLVVAGCAAEPSQDACQALEAGPRGAPGSPGARGPRGPAGKDAFARVYMRRAFFGEAAMCDEGDVATGGTCSSDGAYFNGPEVDEDGTPIGWSCDAEVDPNGHPTTASVVCLSTRDEG